MEDPPTRKPLYPDTISIHLDAKHVEAIEGLIRSLAEPRGAMAKAVEGIDLRGVAQEFLAQKLAVESALPSNEDFWLDFWAFSISPPPCGLGLTDERFWELSYREWLAVYRVWRSGTSHCSANEDPRLKKVANIGSGESTPKEAVPRIQGIANLSTVTTTGNAAGVGALTPIEAGPTTYPRKSTKRLESRVSSPVAARRMEAYMESHGGQTKFAGEAGTTDRTLRSFRRTGKVRWYIFNGIAVAMKTTPEELLKPEPE